MQLKQSIVLTGTILEFYTRDLWTTLIKAEASFTVEVAAYTDTMPNKLVCAFSLNHKSDAKDAERLLLWVRKWASLYIDATATVRIFSPLSSAVLGKIHKMIIGSSLINDTRETHVDVSDLKQSKTHQEDPLRSNSPAV